MTLGEELANRLLRPELAKEIDSWLASYLQRPDVVERAASEVELRMDKHPETIVRAALATLIAPGEQE